MADITFQEVRRDSDQQDEITKIYEEAFPPVEHRPRVDDFFSLQEKGENLHLVSVSKGDELVAFFVTIETGEYAYGFYLAVRSDLRGKGFGTEIMKTLLEKYSDKTMLFTIETPVENAPNYAQRMKREALYTSLGCVRAGYAVDIDGENYTFMCSRLTDKVKGYIEDFLQKINKYKDMFI